MNQLYQPDYAGIAASTQNALLEASMIKQERASQQNAQNALAQAYQGQKPQNMGQFNAQQQAEIQQAIQSASAQDREAMMDRYNVLSTALRVANPENYATVSRDVSQRLGIEVPPTWQDFEAGRGDLSAQMEMIGGALGVTPERPEEYTLSEGQMRFRGATPIAVNRASMQDRETLKGTDGVTRYVDTGEPVLAADAEAIEADKISEQQQEAESNEALAQQTGIVAGYIGEVVDLIAQSPSGRRGQVMNLVNPTGASGELRRKLQTIQSNIGFDKLMEMKRQSPTGGALGAVSERELADLQATLGSLDAIASDEELLGVLENVYGVYNRINQTVGGDPLPEFSSMSGGSSDSVNYSPRRSFQSSTGITFEVE